MLRDVAEAFADDPDEGALHERLEVALGTGLLEVDGESALPAQVVDEAGHRDGEVEPTRLLGLSERGHVLADVGERRARVARGLRELWSEDRWVTLERALAALEREHYPGELLGESIVQLLGDLPALVRGRPLEDVR